MFIISLGLLAPFFATAQEEQTTQQTPQENEKQYPATIEGQYDQLVEKAGNWEKYKLIKKESIYSFKRFMLDSLKAQKQVLREKLDTISSQSSQITQLNQKITSLQSDLDKEKNRNTDNNFEQCRAPLCQEVVCHCMQICGIDPFFCIFQKSV